MRIVALLSGILASAFAWTSAYFVLDLSAQFLTLFPDTNSQQLLGLISWHAFVGSAVFGGLIAVLSPGLGALILLAAAVGWAVFGYYLPAGFSPQVVAPMAFSALGVVTSIGAVVRDIIRRASSRRRPSLEDMAREDALRLGPDDDLRLAVERRSAYAEANNNNDDDGDDDDAAERSQPSSADAIKLAVPRPVQVRPAGLSGLFVANVMVLLLLTLAVAALLYVNIRNGEFGRALGTLPFSAAEEQPAVAAAPEPVAPEKLVTAESAPQATDPIEVASTLPVVPAGPPEAQVSVTSIPLDLAALPQNNWSDPFEYCTAVKTVDFPDRRYIGPRLTDAIAVALNVPTATAPDRAKWRCYDGALLGCANFRGASCALTPTLVEMRQYCAQNPNAQNLLAPNGIWWCNDTTPEVPQGASWPLDPRGFLPGAWVEITAPTRQASAR